MAMKEDYAAWREVQPFAELKIPKEQLGIRDPGKKATLIRSISMKKG